MPPVVHILILAAGSSSRMRGEDKLLRHIQGVPILRRVAETALATGAPVAVTLPQGAGARQAVLAGLSLRLIDVPDADLGMSRSLVRGIADLLTTQPGPSDGLMVLPADMPGFTSAALKDVTARYKHDPWLIWRGAGSDGTPGHPAIFPRDLWPFLSDVRGDEGGRSVLRAKADRVRLVTLPGQMATLDLDTPEDWAAFLGSPA